MTTAPKFVKSPYFVGTPDHWHLKPGAPKEVREEFEKFMEEQKRMNSQGVFI